MTIMLKRVITLGLLLLLPVLLTGQGTLAPTPKFTGFDTNGNPVTGGKLCTYLAGTTTPVATYTDVGLTTPNANPIILDAAGRATIFLSPGTSYKFLLLTAGSDSTCATGTTVWTQDNIQTVPASSQSTDILGTVGVSVTTGQCVYMSDGSGALVAGQWYLCSTANTYSSTTPAVGLATANATGGTVATIRISGLVSGLSSLSVGSTYYVGTAGALTNSAPANYRIVGQAQTATTIVVSPHVSGVASATNLTAGTVPVGRLGSGVTTHVTSNATGTVNDWAPGLSGNSLIVIGSLSPLTITGIAGGQPGQELTIINVGPSTVTLKYQSGSSANGNKILTLTQSDMTLGAPTAFNGSTRLIWDLSTNRWDMVTFTQGDPLSWTPSLTFGGAAVGMTYTTRSGLYWLEGNICHFGGRVTLSAKGSSVGAATITGLPLIAFNNGGYFAHVIFPYFTATVGAQNGVNSYISPNTSTLSLYTPADAGTGVNTMGDANFTNTTDLVFSGSYVVN